MTEIMQSKICLKSRRSLYEIQFVIPGKVEV